MAPPEGRAFLKIGPDNERALLRPYSAGAGSA